MMEWFIRDWHSLFPHVVVNPLLALVAVVCGSIVGVERERREKPAGLRTLTLVSLGAAVFTMISISMDKGDPGRIAAQVVTGIGFLGAGVILRGAGGVTGMTSAATIWSMAAIGMVVGVGYPAAGLALSGLVLAVLTIIRTLEERYVGHCRFSSVVVVFDPAGGKALVKIEEILEEYGVPHPSSHLRDAPNGLKELHLTCCHAHRHHREFLAHVAELDEVREIHRERSLIEDKSS